MALTAAEQYLLELINRARLDPLSEAARYGVSLNAGLTAGTISTSAKQVLAPNTVLEDASQDHSSWMLLNDVFSHTGAGDSNPGDRMSDAGYTFTGSWTWRENLAWSGTTGTLNLTSAIETHHQGLYESSGHRANTFAESIREIGIAQVAGTFTVGVTDFNASMLTLKFAASGSDAFVTGVSYRDTDGDGFYDIGEARTGIWVSVDGTTQSVASAGGYGIGASPASDVAVSIGTGGTVLATLEMDLTDGNGKLDIITASNGDLSLALSASATLLTGIADATLLGIANLDLTGSNVANTLIGNVGNNILYGLDGNDVISGGMGMDALYGGAGNDYLKGGGGRSDAWGDLDGTSAGSNTDDNLSGGSGNDMLIGLSGNDVLNGGTGDDTMSGGGGRDTFVFNDGADTITDFTTFVDQITLDAAALGDPGLTVAEVIAMGTVVGGDAVFDFGGGDVLTLTGVTNISALAGDLNII